ncbi:ribonuclease III [Sorangium cellulosum]|uniref:Ribonuclease 3 n=1 Tax=Sorangium cellulosum TaxID=56 RepID=A0A150PJ90_SORCE|nr:ribonuclease III [Sorangium cellulosum]
MLPSELLRRLDLGLEGDLPHLEEALTHPSFSNEQRGGRRVDNQRLEFLGDAVLGLCVTELLMERFPGAREGELSMMRSALVNTDALASWARGVELGAALRVGRGAEVAGERDQTNVLADATEALVAALYLDRGFESARALSRKIVASPLSQLASGGMLGRDAKSELQERVQARGAASPRYRLMGTEGPDHDRAFLVAVEVEGKVIGTGRGRSKKLAEQAAARAALAACASPEPRAATDATDEQQRATADALEGAPEGRCAPPAGGASPEPPMNDRGTSR